MLGNVFRCSSLYKTAAWGKTNQPDFVNQAIHMLCRKEASEVLSIIQQIEQSLGRQRTEHWGQRTIDIDILAFGSFILHSEALAIPHPAIALRRFALIPLQEIAPDWVHPQTRQSIEELIRDCPDRLAVEKLSTSL